MPLSQHSLKKLISYCLLLIIVNLVASCSKDSQPTPKHLKNLHDEDLSGSWLVINYWASWCKPCIAEIPELNSFAATASNTKVYAVNYDGITGEQLLSEASRLNIQFPLLETDPATSMVYPRPSVLPTTLIISPKGELTATLIGPQTRESLDKALTSNTN